MSVEELDPSDFKYCTTVQFANGHVVALVAESMIELTAAWRQLTDNRVPFRKEMVQEVKLTRR